ncbi:MAG: protein-tyrosine-phosphatase, partial [Bacteroidota bacterium]
MSLYSKLDNKLKQLSEQAIDGSRFPLLNRFTDYLLKQNEESAQINLNFICTHNSRRSHISQIWAATLAYHFGFEKVHTYSGGTEATAFNPRAVRAMREVGFQIKEGQGDNPKYQVSFAEEAEPVICFSKVYDHPDNPKKDFAAIMTCSEADVNCPFIPGASWRLPLTYEDPKVADGTAEE